MNLPLLADTLKVHHDEAPDLVRGLIHERRNPDPGAAALIRGLIRANADETTVQAAARLVIDMLNSQCNGGARHLPVPYGCDVRDDYTANVKDPTPPRWSWDAAFARAAQEMRDEYEECNAGRLQHYGAPETAWGAAVICAMIAAKAAARNWLHALLGSDARDGRPAGTALRLAAEQVAFSAAMHAVAAAARAAREPQDRPQPAWMVERDGGEPEVVDLLTQRTTGEWTTTLYRAAMAALTAVRAMPAEGDEPAARVRAELLERVAAGDRTIDDGRALMEAGADQRAEAIRACVDSYGRRGRDETAALLGVHVATVDIALRRARTAR